MSVLLFFDIDRLSIGIYLFISTLFTVDLKLLIYTQKIFV